MAKSLKEKRQTKHYRVRAKISAGTADRPRLNVFKSNTGIYAQVINDDEGKTIASASTVSLKLKGNNIENAKKIGAEVANKAIAAGVKEVVFDRGGFIYHGKIQALADAAREAGLKF